MSELERARIACGLCMRLLSGRQRRESRVASRESRVASCQGKGKREDGAGGEAKKGRGKAKEKARLAMSRRSPGE